MRDEGSGGVTLTVRRECAPAEPTAPEYLTKNQVARRLNVSVRTVDNLMRQGVLPYHKLGRLVRFQPADVDAQLARTCRVCNGETGKAEIGKAESRN